MRRLAVVAKAWTVAVTIDSWQVFGPLLLETDSEDFVRRDFELDFLNLLPSCPD